MSDPPAELSGLEAAERAFKESGLPLPPIPDRFAKALRQVEPWCFSTRQIVPFQMYLFDDYVWEAVAGQTPEYLAFSHAGHGINSYAITYHLVDGPLVLIVQAPWGGVYSDQKQDVGALGSLFARCASLTVAATDARVKSVIGAASRLCVFESEMRGSFSWGLLEQPAGSEDEAAKWVSAHAVHLKNAERLEADLPTSQALRWLTQTMNKQAGLTE